MNLADAPAKLVEAFAAGGSFNVIPVPSQIPITPGAASWTTGFPPLTMTPVSSGGIPPSGLDMNGLGNALSALLIWFNAGAGFPWDSAFSTAVGGYPAGARVLAATGVGYWLSTADDNTTNPDAGGAGWVLQGVLVAASVYASAQQTSTIGNYKVLFDTVEFDHSIWDATNKRFNAPIAGRYRLSGAVLFAAPAGQELATQIWKNGALAKQCSQAPQVSTGNLSMPFEAIISLATGDFLEVFVNVPTTAVAVGISGSNQAFVFAQIAYLGT